MASVATRGSLEGGRIEDVAYLDHSVRGFDAEVGSIAQRFSSLIVQDGEEDHVLRFSLLSETCGERFLVGEGAVEG